MANNNHVVNDGAEILDDVADDRSMQNFSDDEETRDGKETTNDNEGTRIEDKKMTDDNGEIGYFLKKGTEFVPMTNFSVECTGYVVESPSSGSSEGFLFKVIPKASISNEENTTNIRSVLNFLSCLLWLVMVSLLISVTPPIPFFCTKSADVYEVY